MGMFEIKKCGDCIHADVCEHNPNIPLFNRANAAFCEGFKDRNELIEVVRCRDCKHYVLQACACRHENFNGIIHMNGYCSYGERKDND